MASNVEFDVSLPEQGVEQTVAFSVLILWWRELYGEENEAEKGEFDKELDCEYLNIAEWSDLFKVLTIAIP